MPQQIADPGPEPQAWRTLATREVFTNRWAALLIDEVELPDGQQYEYTRLRPAGIGVAVAAFNAAGDILLEREYRHGLGEVIWQLPGGLADEGEALIAAGLRELAEETGYAPASSTEESNSEENVRYLGSVWDNPGLGPAESHIVAVWNVVESHATTREASEFITLHWVTPAWLKEAVRSGAIRERTTVAAVAYLILNGLL